MNGNGGHPMLIYGILVRRKWHRPCRFFEAGDAVGLILSIRPPPLGQREFQQPAPAARRRGGDSHEAAASLEATETPE